MGRVEENAPRPRVLVIDDDDDVADVLRDSLSREGYAVATVRHGAAALDLLAQRPVDVILLDLRMPIMDGWSFAERYRAAAKERAAAIIVFSAIPNVEEVARRLGAEAAVRKPFDLDTVHDLVDRFTGRRSLGA